MYDGEKAKYELVSAWLAGHPCPSWGDVCVLLWKLEREGKGRKGAEDEVKEKYLTSELQYTTCSFTKFSANLRNTLYVYTHVHVHVHVHIHIQVHVCVQCVFRSSGNDLYTVYMYI